MELQRSNHVRQAVLAGLLLAASPLIAGPASRLQADIQSRHTFVLKGNIHPLLASAEDQGEAPGTLFLPRITMHFQMTAAQQADLDQLLAAQQDPSSPQFHQWLTPELYAERFGMSRTGTLSVEGCEEAVFTRRGGDGPPSDSGCAAP